MRIIYGKDPSPTADPRSIGIELEVVRTLKFERTNVYDSSGLDVIAQKWNIEVLALINRAATSFAGSIGAFATRSPGQRAIVTDEAIRHTLMEPRRILRILSDELVEAEVARELLHVPDETRGYVCDVRGGPFPQEFHIIQVWGAPETLVCYYRIEAFVNECAEEDRNVVISHKWSQLVDVDSDHFAVRVTQGEVVFDLSELVKAGQVGDQFRQDILHPVPSNMRRERINVRVSEDGTRLNYQSVDRECSHNLGPNSPATRVEAYHTTHVHQPGFGRLADVTLDVVGDLIKNMGEGKWGSLFRGAKAMMPRMYESVFIRCWGDRDTRRIRLTNLAFAIAAARLGQDFARRFLPSVDMTLTRDLMGKFVELSVVRELPPGAASIFGIAANVNSFFTDNEDIANPNGGVVVISTGDGQQNPNFPAGNGSRGTWVANIVAQALDGPCEIPAAPVSVDVPELSFRE